MNSKFYITGVQELDREKCFHEALNAFPEGVEPCVKQYITSPKDNEPELEEVLAFIDGQSIGGIKVSLLKSGETTVFLGWNVSGMDVHLCFDFLHAVKKMYPHAVITTCDDEGNNTHELADLSEEAMYNEWEHRIENYMNLMELTDEEVINIPGVRYPYHLMPAKFAQETEGMELGDKFKKLLDDIIELQWYDKPKQKTYLLRWNTAISNFKMKDFEDCMKRFNEPESCLSWCIWDWQDVRIGDKVYMLRVGEGTTGIVMCGKIISEPYVSEDWSGKGRVTHYVNIALEQMMHPEKAVIPQTEDLQNRFEEVEWTSGHSGTLLDEETAYQINKFYDKFLVDNREQFAVNSDNGKAITSSEIPSEYKDYFDAEQGHGGHWATICDADSEDLAAFIMNHLRGSDEIDSVQTFYGDYGMQNISGVTTEDEEIGVCGLIAERGEQQYEFLVAYPDLKNTGTEVEMTLVKIQEYASRIEAVLTGETADGTELAFFDTRYFLNKDRYKIGEKYTFKLAALARRAEVLPEEDRVVSFSVEQTIKIAEAAGEEVERDVEGNVITRKLLMDKAVYCVNMTEEIPDVYDFQSPVSNAKAIKVLGTPMYRMDVICIRTEEEPAALSLPLYARKAFFGGKPKKNTPVRGSLWMFGAMV